MFLLVSLGQRQQNALEAGTPLMVLRRKIRAAGKRLAFRSKKRGQRPATLSADGLHRRLVTAVHVRALIAVDFDGDEMLVDDGGRLRRFVRLAVHHMAPMAPHRANIEQNGLVLPCREIKCFLSPLMPPYRLV